MITKSLKKPFPISRTVDWIRRSWEGPGTEIELHEAQRESLHFSGGGSADLLRRYDISFAGDAQGFKVDDCIVGNL